MARTLIEIRTLAGDYRCCMADAMYRRMMALRYGDTDLAEDLLMQALVLHQAARVLGSYPDEDGNCCGEVPSTIEQVECAISMASCYCRTCECASPMPEVVSCDPTVIWAAGAVATTTDRQTIENDTPATGAKWFVASGATDGAWTSPSIQEWDGSAWSSDTVEEDQVVSVNGILWTVSGGTGVPLYPNWTFVLTDPNGGYTAHADDPLTISFGRDIEIRTLHNGVWTTVYYAQEDDLPGMTVFFGSLPFDEVRVYYVEGECEHSSAASVMIPPQNTCGTLTHSMALVNDCNAGTFHLQLTISDVDGYLLGPLSLVVNGLSVEAHAIAVGTSTFGPWDVGTTIAATITNANNPECNIALGTFGPGSCLCTVPTAIPVDADFEPSAQAGVTYFIESNLNAWGGQWASQVGYLVKDGVFTLVPYSGEIQLSGDPEDRVVWTPTGLHSFNPGATITWSGGNINIISQDTDGPHYIDRVVRVTIEYDVIGEHVVWEGPEVDFVQGVSVPDQWAAATYAGGNVEYLFGGCVINGKEPQIVTPGRCEEPTSISLIVPDGEAVDSLIVDNTTDLSGGYFMIEGDATVYDDSGTSLTGGRYCIYTTDSGGNVDGAPSSIYLDSATLSDLDGGQFASLLYIGISAHNLTMLDVSAWTAATGIELYANGLTTLDVSAWTAEYIYLTVNSLITLDVSAWMTTTNVVLTADNLTTLDTSAWAAAVFISLTCSSLSSITVPAAFADDSGQISFFAFATILDQASVDAILAAAVANASIVSGAINLGGTCAAPSASGYADKATLIARGVTVITN